jgi:hypothetical protein
VNTIMPYLANMPALPFEGARRGFPVMTSPLPDQAPSDVVVQALAWDRGEEATVHVYVNDQLSLTLTPAEARTLAAGLSFSAGEIDGHGPAEARALRIA